MSMRAWAAGQWSGSRGGLPRLPAGDADPAEWTAILDRDRLDPDADPLERAERALLRTVLPEPAREDGSARRNA
ncbi:hypothetical protein [Kitasatospora sp. NPDC058190]|uniref:hypothetical protein n=1 Tax=Kitasatospora sp. NPDC058190 TaxID=3346371 RepID=UPI0036DA94F5